MAGDENDEQRAADTPPPRPGPSKHTSTAAGRAAKRRVDLDGTKRPAGEGGSTTAPSPGGGTGGTGDKGGSKGGGGGRRAVQKPPLYRRGAFWFWVIVAEVLVALFLSYRFERPTDSVDLGGTDTAQFCLVYNDLRTKSLATASIDVANAVPAFEAELEAVRRLRQVAPADLQYDLDRVIVGTEELVVTARTVQEKKQADAGYLGGINDIQTKQQELEVRNRVANLRVKAAVRQACGIDVDAVIQVGTTTTTAPAGSPGSVPPGPGVAGTGVPGSGPAGSTVPGSGPAGADAPGPR